MDPLESDTTDRPDPAAAAGPASVPMRRPTAELLIADTYSPTARPAGPLQAATGVVRVAIAAAAEVTGWGVRTALGVTGTVLRGSIAGRPPAEVLTEAGEQVRDSVRRALGVPDPGTASAPDLRRRGAELLRLSATVHGQDDGHPAFARMLTELAPDEARILRFLFLDGAQPALNVRTARSLNTGARRIEMGLNMIAADAALRFADRVSGYLTNLQRLGLIILTTDPLDNPIRYQLLEAQPEVRILFKRNGFGTKVSYRSIALTGFGTDFVRTCLPVPPVDRAL